MKLSARDKSKILRLQEVSRLLMLSELQNDMRIFLQVNEALNLISDAAVSLRDVNEKEFSE